MKVKEYIKQHPRTMLAKELSTEGPKKEIIVGKGLISQNIKSNLGIAINEAGKRYKGFKVGGRAGRSCNDGSHWAVILK